MDNLTSKQSGQLDRLDYIDGIRGIASLLVVFCHLSCVFLWSICNSTIGSSYRVICLFVKQIVDPYYKIYQNDVIRL